MVSFFAQVVCVAGNAFADDCFLWGVPLGGVPFPAVVADAEYPSTPVGRKDGRL